MKKILLHLLKALLFPLLWCRQTILEASEFWNSNDPVEFTEYLDFHNREDICSSAPVGRRKLCPPGENRLNVLF